MLPYTRREFAKLALAAFPAAGMLSVPTSLAAADKPAPARGKPNSKVAGVQIGINVPYSFGGNAVSGDDTLANCVQLGLSAVELRAQPIEAYLGAPANLVGPKNAVATGGAAASNADLLRQWRSTVKVEKAAGFRKKYEDAGVRIEILKVDNLFKISEAELDYAFALAKTVGARAISSEISKSDDDHKRVGRIADKHQTMIGYHGHASTTPEHWEKAFSFAKHNGANVDIGHFVAGNDGSPVDFIKKHHARITHVHIKDRKRSNGPNVPFGEGDTPIVEVLRLIRDNKWNIQATIEFEYKIPTGSDRMTEIARAVKFCRDALV
jgi:sugar phosphate isomerase/epimerase